MSDGEGITSVSLDALKLVCSLYGSHPPYKVMECDDTPLASLQVESDSSSVWRLQRLHVHVDNFLEEF